MITGDESLLSARNLSISFEGKYGVKEAVRNVSVEIGRNERVGIIGESGSGKSVLCRTLCAIESEVRNCKYDGTVLFENRDLLRLPKRELEGFRKSGVLSIIFQNPSEYLNPTMKIGRQMGERFAAGVDRKKKERRIDEVLQWVELRDPQIKRKYPHQLSGGMQQRVMIAMALINEPKMLIADEPTTALDLTVQKEVLRTLDKVQRESKMAFLIVTHDLGVVAEMCDRVYVMRHGVVVEEGNVFDIFEQPKHPYTSELVNGLKTFM